MIKIPFENGTEISNAYVEIGGVRYNVVYGVYEGKTPFSAENINQMQDNIENAIEEGQVLVEDNLSSESAANALSAKQGKILNEKISNINIISVRLADRYTVSQASTEETLPMNTRITGLGNKLTLQNNGVVVGSGIRAVKVQGQMKVRSIITANESYTVAIYVNDSQVAQAVAYLQDGYTTLTTSMKIVGVNEGSTITMRVLSSEAGGVIENYNYATFLTVEGIE